MTAQHANPLGKGGFGNGCYQYPVGTAHLFLDFGNHIGFLGVQRPVCAKILGQGQLILTDINRNDLHTHGLGVLNSHMAQAADTGNDNRFTRFAFGFLKPLIDRDTGT